MMDLSLRGTRLLTAGGIAGPCLVEPMPIDMPWESRQQRRAKARAFTKAKAKARRKGRK